MEELLKMLTANELVAQIISFLILFFLLRAFFWKRFLKLLDERKERVASEYKTIEEQKALAQKERAEYEEKLMAIEDAAKKKIQEAVSEGQKIIQQIKEEARNEAAKIITDAKEHVSLELVKAKEELKDEMVDLVLDATEQLLAEKMDDQEDRRVVKDFLDKLDKS